MQSVPASPAMDKEEARDYLSSLLNHTLRVVVTDGRMFSGSFKCTDPVSLLPLGRS